MPQLEKFSLDNAVDLIQERLQNQSALPVAKCRLIHRHSWQLHFTNLIHHPPIFFVFALACSSWDTSSTIRPANGPHGP